MGEKGESKNLTGWVRTGAQNDLLAVILISLWWGFEVCSCGTSIFILDSRKGGIFFSSVFFLKGVGILSRGVVQSFVFSFVSLD